MGRIRGVKNRATGTVGDVYHGSRRRVRRFFIDTENTKLVIGFVTVAVALSLAVPTLFPELKRSGPTCTDLNAPPGGNRRSMLAENDNQQDLALEIDIDAPTQDGDPTIRLGDTLIVNVVFKNEDIGALILYLRDNFEAIAPAGNLNSASITGLYLEIAPVGSTQSLVDTASPPRLPALTTFNEEQDLHVIQARRRCVMQVIFTRDRLARMGIVGPGQYSIRAYYGNQSVGFVSPDDLVKASATPMFLTNGQADQGVWTGVVQSKSVQFNISP